MKGSKIQHRYYLFQNYFKIAMHVKLGNRCDTIVIGSQTNFRA